MDILPSINQLPVFLNCVILFGGRVLVAGTYPSMHWIKGRVKPQAGHQFVRGLNTLAPFTFTYCTVLSYLL